MDNELCSSPHTTDNVEISDMDNVKGVKGVLSTPYESDPNDSAWWICESCKQLRFENEDRHDISLKCPFCFAQGASKQLSLLDAISAIKNNAYNLEHKLDELLSDSNELERPYSIYVCKYKYEEETMNHDYLSHFCEKIGIEKIIARWKGFCLEAGSFRNMNFKMCVPWRDMNVNIDNSEDLKASNIFFDCSVLVYDFTSATDLLSAESMISDMVSCIQANSKSIGIDWITQEGVDDIDSEELNDDIIAEAKAYVLH